MIFSYDYYNELQITKISLDSNYNYRCNYLLTAVTVVDSNYLINRSY